MILISNLVDSYYQNGTSAAPFYAVASTTAEFTVVTLDLKQRLEEFRKLQKKYFKTGLSKIRVMPNSIEISGMDVYQHVHADTQGLAEVFVPLHHMYSYVQDA